jgi:hypothetical protein
MKRAYNFVLILSGILLFTEMIILFLGSTFNGDFYLFLDFISNFKVWGVFIFINLLISSVLLLNNALWEYLR